LPKRTKCRKKKTRRPLIMFAKKPNSTRTEGQTKKISRKEGKANKQRKKKRHISGGYHGESTRKQGKW